MSDYLQGVMLGGEIDSMITDITKAIDAEIKDVSFGMSENSSVGMSTMDADLDRVVKTSGYVTETEKLHKKLQRQAAEEAKRLYMNMWIQKGMSARAPSRIRNRV